MDGSSRVSDTRKNKEECTCGELGILEARSGCLKTGWAWETPVEGKQ